MDGVGNEDLLEEVTDRLVGEEASYATMEEMTSRQRKGHVGRPWGRSGCGSQSSW